MSTPIWNIIIIWPAASPAGLEFNAFGVRRRINLRSHRHGIYSLQTFACWFFTQGGPGPSKTDYCEGQKEVVFRLAAETKLSL